MDCVEEGGDVEVSDMIRGLVRAAEITDYKRRRARRARRL